MPITLDPAILCDTNIVARFANFSDSRHSLIVQATLSLQQAGYRLLYAPQTLREFWNVATRPSSVNGFDLTIAQAEELTQKIEAAFILLRDTDAMHTVWRSLVVRHEVKGVQVHDARLASSALVGGCRAILTLNDADFKRFGVAPLHPGDMAAFLTNV